MTTVNKRTTAALRVGELRQGRTRGLRAMRRRVVRPNDAMMRNAAGNLKIGMGVEQLVQYGLSDVVVVLSRLFEKHEKRYRRLKRRRPNWCFKKHVRKMLHVAFSTALLSASSKHAAQRRNALLYVLAAASLPLEMRAPIALSESHATSSTDLK